MCSCCLCIACSGLTVVSKHIAIIEIMLTMDMLPVAVMDRHTRTHTHTFHIHLAEAARVQVLQLLSIDSNNGRIMALFGASTIAADIAAPAYSAPVPYAAAAPAYTAPVSYAVAAPTYAAPVSYAAAAPACSTASTTQMMARTRLDCLGALLPHAPSLYTDIRRHTGADTQTHTHTHTHTHTYTQIDSN